MTHLASRHFNLASVYFNLALVHFHLAMVCLPLPECVFVLWRIWKSRNATVFKGTLINPMDGVNLVRHQLLELRALHITKQHAADPYVETNGAIFAGQQVGRV